jgi:nucleotide-binding universal stress UspA family protein
LILVKSKALFEQHCSVHRNRASSVPYMYKHILIAADGSELAGKAAADSLVLAKAPGARVTAVAVTDIFPTGPKSPIPFPATIERYATAASEGAAMILASVAAAAAAQLGVSCRTVHVKDQHQPRAATTWW